MMDELACFMDWDLEAIVRGCSIKAPVTTTIMEDDPHPHHLFPEVEDGMLFSFPEFSETTRVFDELEELYKPFYPVFHALSSPQAIVTTSLPIPEEPEQQAKLLIKPSQKVLAPQDLQAPAASKPKRSSKKSANKKVAKEVKAADISVSDAWAWRKYGQKPIKGSPYPRSYYRCSSCKGCSARKQVERSNKDPGVFLVTYTAEHSNHPQPTRRNSLAGSTRKTNSIVAPLPSNYASCSSNSSSPRTPLVLVESMEESGSEGLIIQKEGDFVQVLDDGWFPTTERDELIIRGSDEV